MTIRATLSHVDGTTTFSIDSRDPFEVIAWLEKLDHEGSDFHITICTDGTEAHKVLTAMEPLRP